MKIMTFPTSLFLFLLLNTISSSLFAKNVPVYTEENKKIIQSKNQTEFMIQLPSNPTTGYSWFLKSYDKKYLRVIRHQYIPPQEHKRIGASGVERWTFQLAPEAFSEPHILTIKLVYERPWEVSDVPDSRVFQVMTQ